MDIFWISIYHLQKTEFISQISRLGNKTIIFTPNPEILLKAKNDSQFQDTLKTATYLTSDGIGLYIAFQILESKKSFPINILLLPYYFFNLFFRRKSLYEKYGDRICWNDLTKELLSIAEKDKIPLMVVDLYNPSDKKKVNAQAIFLEKMKEVYPNVQIELFIWNPKEKTQILEMIKNSKARILFSTLWMKLQEENVIEIMNYCPNIVLGLWVGSSFDSITGLQKRAPLLWRKSWFEWLYRLLFWPQKVKRLKRLWNAIFVFIFEVYKEKKEKDKK